MRGGIIAAVALALLLLAAWGCGGEGDDAGPDASTGADADSDTDADADSDTDADSGTDADSDSDTDSDTDTDTDADTDTDTDSDSDTDSDADTGAALRGRALGLLYESDTAEPSETPLNGVRVFRYSEFGWPEGEPETETAADGEQDGVYQLSELPTDSISHIVADGDETCYGAVTSTVLPPGLSERDLELVERQHLEAIAADGGVSIEPQTGIVILTARPDAPVEVQRWGPIGDAVDLGGGRSVTFNIPEEHNGRGFVEVALGAEDPPPPTAHDCDTLGRPGAWDDSRPVLVIDDHVSAAAVHCVPNLAIAEIHPQPAADLNGDLAIDDGDELVELVNTTEQILQLDGWVLEDGQGSLLHEFDQWLFLAPGAAVVVFGGGGIAPADVGQSCATTASEGSLSLGDATGSIVVKDGEGRVVDSAGYDAGSLAAGASLARPSCFDVELVSHCEASSLLPCAELSPGRDVDLEDYAACEPLVVDLSGTVVELTLEQPDGGPPAIENATVEVYGHPEIDPVVTGPDGAFEFSDVLHHEVLYVLATPPDSDHWGEIKTVRLELSDMQIELHLLPDSLVQSILAPVTEIDPASGMLVVNAVEGAEVALQGAPGAEALVLDGTTATQGNIVPPGEELVMFVNVPPGDGITASVTPPAPLTCELPGQDSNEFEPALVLAGHRGELHYECQ